MSKRLVVALVVLVIVMATATVWAGAKTYQVTGPVLEIRGDIIVIQKGTDKWEINKGDAKITGDLKVGAKVTIEYTMTAAKIDVKSAVEKETVPTKNKSVAPKRETKPTTNK